MSEMAPEPAPKPEGRGVKGALTRKIGPLPTWVWVVIIAAIILVYVWWKNSQANQQPQQATAGPGQVPQFVNQTFVQPGPPPAADQDQDEDKTPKPAPVPMPAPMPPHPKPPARRPPWGGGEPPPGPPKGHGIEPPWGRGRRERRRRERRTDKVPA